MSHTLRADGTFTFKKKRWQCARVRPGKPIRVEIEAVLPYMVVVRRLGKVLDYAVPAGEEGD